MSTTKTLPEATRLVVAAVDSDRIIHVQDLLPLRNPDYVGDVVEISLVGQDPVRIAVLADEAVIVVTVRESERWELAACIVPLLGTIEGQGGR